MPPAYEVARFLVRIAANGEEYDVLTPPRLLKLLHDVQAWSNGPVVRDLDVKHGIKGARPIVPDDVDGGGNVDLSDEDASHVYSVRDVYNGCTAWVLREMTHEETPWIDARRGYGPGDKRDVEITRDAMRAYFSAPPE